MEDKNIDVIISLLPPMMVPPEMTGRFNPEQLRSMQVEYRKHMDLLNQIVMQYGKPLILLRLFFTQPAGESNVSLVTPKERIPEYSTPRQVARVLRHLMSYRQYLEYRNT
jgi:hypothetical protein